MYGFDDLNYAVLVIGRVIDAASPDVMRAIGSVVSRWSDAHQSLIVSVPAGSALDPSPAQVVVGVRVVACGEEHAVPTGAFGDDHVAERAAVARSLPEAFWTEVGEAAGDPDGLAASPLAAWLVASGRWPFAALIYGARCFAEQAAGHAFLRGHSPDEGSSVVLRNRMGAAGVEVARASHDGARIVSVDFDAQAHAARTAAVAGLAGNVGYQVIASFGAPHAAWRPPGWAPPPSAPLPPPAARPELHAAAAAGDLARVRELLDGGAALDEHSDEEWPFNEWTALHHAALRGRLEVVSELLARGADPNAWGGYAMPLHFAAGGGHLEVVRALLAGGAELGETGSEGFTALHYAAQQGQLEVVRALLAEGAEVRSEGPWRPLHCAALGGLFATREAAHGRRPIEEGERAAFVEIVRLLCEAGDEPIGELDNFALPLGSGGLRVTPLGMAVRWGTVALVRELLERGALVEDSAEMPLLTLAACSVRDAEEKVKLLRERGCTPAPDRAPGFHSMTYAFLVAGKVVSADDVTTRQVRELVALAQRWHDERGLAVVAIPGGDMYSTDAVEDDDNACVTVTIGLAVAHSSIADEPTPVSLAAMQQAIAAARDLPPAFWDEVRALLWESDAEAIATAPVELHLTACGPLPLAQLHLGACTEEPGAYWYLNERDYGFTMAPLGVDALSVASASYDGSEAEVVDVSDEAHAERLASVPEALRDRATYLLRAQYD